MQSVFRAVLCAVVVIMSLSKDASYTGRRSSFITEYLEETPQVQVSTSDKRSFLADLLSCPTVTYGRVNADQDGKPHADIPADDIETKKLAQGILQGQSNHSDGNGPPPNEQQGEKTRNNKKGSTNKALKERYTDPNYVPSLIYGETGRIRSWKDCSCGKCKDIFKNEPDLMQDIRRHLEFNWGEGATGEDRLEHLNQDLMVGISLDGKGGARQEYFIAGRKVCYNFYLAARGYNHSWVSTWSTKWFEEEKTLLSTLNARGQRNKAPSAAKKLSFAAWLRVFAQTFGDKMSDATGIALPYRRLEGIYLEYKKEMIERGLGQQDYCSYSYACQVFNEMDDIRLARRRGTLPGCKICTAYQDRLLKASSTAERDTLKEYRQMHVEKQYKERLCYYEKIEYALKYPDNAISIIIDGMDQSKCNLPVDKVRVNHTHVVKQRVMGVKVHGIQDYLFVTDSNVKGGANLVAEVLRRVLVDLEDQGKLPRTNPTLFLQCDNCSENKNRCFFAFLAHLVERGTFDKIVVGFLIPGHSHEDIDQMFSVISSHLRDRNISCASQQIFFEALQTAFTRKGHPAPRVEQIGAPEVFNYDDMYLPLVNKKLAHISKPHQFRFQMFGGRVLVHYKRWSTHEVWLPQEVPPVKTTEEQEASLPEKSRRGRSSKTSKKKRHTKKSTPAKRARFDVDDEELDDFDPSDPTGVYSEEYQSELPSQGIRWLEEPFPCPTTGRLVTLTQEQNTKYLANARLMHSYITGAKTRENPAMYTAEVIGHWDEWLAQNVMWFEGKQQQPPPTPRYPAACPAPAGPPLVIPRSEAPEPEAGVEIVAHDSGAHGVCTSGQVLQNRKIALSELSLLGTDIVTGLYCLYCWDDPVVFGQERWSGPEHIDSALEK